MFFLFLYFLSQQKGDIIDVLSMNASGIWKGRCHGRLGHFKFINVEVLPDQRLKHSHSKNLAGLTGKSLSGAHNTGGSSGNGGSGTGSGGRHLNHNNGPHSVEDLLMRIGLKEYTSVFVLNG